jgi:tetratricopeptide (TPR) repeat protein
MTDVETKAPRKSRKAIWVLLIVVGIIVGIYGLVAVALYQNQHAQASLNRNVKVLSRFPIGEFITLCDPNKRQKSSEFEMKLLEAERLATKKDYPGMHAAFVQAEESCAAALGPKSEFMRSVLNRQGQCELEFGKWQVAIDALTQAIALEPDEASAYVWRARAYCGAKQYDKAIIDYTKILSIHPNSSQFYSQRGHAFNLSRNYRRAIDDFTASLTAGPGDVSTYSDLAYAYKELGESQKQLEALNKGIELEPTSICCHLERAEWYRQHGQNDLADKDEKMVKSLEPKPRDASNK